MNICNCHIDIDKYLCDIPHEWRKPITDALCFVLNINDTGCAGIQECETNTSLSAFILEDTVLSITYTNEKGSISVATVDISPLLENSLDAINPLCLMSQNEWNALTHKQRMAAIIDALCPCCITTTTTTTTSTSSTSTTSTSSTTSTTTTHAPCQNVLLTSLEPNTTEFRTQIMYKNCNNTFTTISMGSGESITICIYPGSIGNIFGLTMGSFSAVLTGTLC